MIKEHRKKIKNSIKKVQIINLVKKCTKKEKSKSTICNKSFYKLQPQTGITLIALVITIIILLILAGITISAITGENGLINSAGVAKEETEIANEREIVEKATVQAMGNNKYGNLEESELQEQLDKETGEGKTEATDIGDEFEVVFVESNRYYTVDKDGNVTQVQEIIEDNSPGDITVGKDGEELDGTEENPYEIWCIEDLVAFSNMVNGSGIKLENGEPVEITSVNYFNGKYVSLKVNLNFKSKLSYQDSERTDFGDINGDESDGNTLMNEMTTGTGFTPIGLSGSFNGTFDGENYQISNIYINYENDTELNGYGFGRGVGLFGAGSTSYTTIKNLEISGEITGAGHTGGIIGGNAKSIENCINHANVTGYNMVGGIIGNTCLNISSCQNDGNINITGASWSYAGAGGIVGNPGSSTVNNCINEGEITGEISYLGGIAGTGNDSSVIISNCYNTGKSGNAGILGFHRNSTVVIENCYNIGECTNGIVGYYGGAAWGSILNLTIQNSYNLGTASNAGIVGSIGTVCAEITLNLNNCYTAGKSDKAIIGAVSYSSSTVTTINIQNTYYDETKATSIGAISDGVTVMQIQNNNEFVELLNANIGDNTTWKTWILGDDGYPTLSM